MKSWALELFTCPDCGDSLSLEVFTDRGHDEDGLFSCQGCGDSYPLITGIPRFVDTSHIETAPSFQRYVHEYEAELDDQDLMFTPSHSSGSGATKSLEALTDESFGYQWRRFSDWGWMPEDEVSGRGGPFYAGASLSDTRSAWISKSLMTDQDIAADKTILDAGCGNGRFSHQAASNGGQVIAADIGTATVEAAHSNCREDDVQVIQANLLELPFPPESFDTIFSIGVLHHTGDAREAFRSLGNRLKPGGVITAHVYHELNPVWEFNDAAIRTVTTRLSVKQNIRFARFMSGVAKALHRIHPLVLHGANLFVRLQPTVTHMFDWYSAPVASHHTYSEVERWFLDDGFAILQSNKPEDYDKRHLLKPWAATVKGTKLPTGRSVEHHPWFS